METMLQPYSPRFFKECEFVQAVPACTLSDMSPELLERLDYARSLYGKPIQINSAFRSVEYEHNRGRSGTSSHCKGLAVDVKCVDIEDRFGLVQSFLRAGFRRIGIAKTYIHVDIDSSKTNCMWLYDNR